MIDSRRDMENPLFREKLNRINALLTTNWQEANSNIPFLEASLLEIGGYESREDFIRKISPSISVLSIVGGVSSRWDASFDDEEGAKIASEYDIRRGKSRFLAEIPNFLPAGVSDNSKISVLEYNLFCIRNLLVSPEGTPLGKHVLIYGKDEDKSEIESITRELGIHQSKILKQEIHEGQVKPSGHADALLQHVNTFKDSKYVITHFGGDVISFTTTYLSLLALDVLNKSKSNLALVLPTANMQNPPYPVFVDSNGLPRRFGHAKLFGDESLKEGETVEHLTLGGSNVSIRAYDTKELTTALSTLGPRYVATGEFALDHVDKYFADQRKMRQFAIAKPEEITHAAKTITQLPLFIQNAKTILSEDRI